MKINHSEACPVYSPEKYGLSLVAEVEFGEPYYSFDTLWVWRASDGLLYWAGDEGCSCPCPLEDLESLDRLFGFDQLDEYRKGRYSEPRVDDWASFKEKVSAAIASGSATEGESK